MEIIYNDNVYCYLCGFKIHRDMPKVLFIEYDTVHVIHRKCINVSKEI